MAKDASETRLATYLKSVQDGSLLNYPVLERELIKRSIPESTIRECFFVELVKANKYRVRIKDEACFEALYARFSQRSLENRASAAVLGNSHRTKVSGSFLLLRNQESPLPVVVWFEADTFHCPLEQSRFALLVENLENFIATDQMVSFLHRCGVTVNVDQIDVIYASGNQITNGLHGSFLTRYQALYCLFDVDLGAFKMYQTLCQLLPDTLMEFVYPEDIVQRLQESERRMTVDERADLLRYVGHSVELDQLIQYMRDTGNKLEQETYLVHQE